MPTYTFDGPTRKAIRKGVCPTCEKPSTRSTTFSGTVNPFNKRPDGAVKTWAEVAEDVQANADAWQPQPEEFEHENCKAQRLAPEPAGQIPVSRDRAVKADGLRHALASVAEFTARNGVPLTSVTVKPDWTQQGKWCAETAFVPDGDIVMWARAFGLDTVPVEDGGHCTYIRIRHDAPDLIWRVHAAVSKPSLGDRLGDAQINWKRDERGRKTKYGTVTVDELEAGLARMGIAVTVAAEREAGAA